MHVLPIIQAIQWSDGGQVDQLKRLFSEYAADEAIAGKAIPDAIVDRSMLLLSSYPNAWVALAFQGETAMGFTITFERLSTFAAAPIINIHDVAVSSQHRGKGIGRKLIEAVIDRARFRGACRVNLEVYRENETAKKLYEKLGFVSPGHDDERLGETLFMERNLQDSN